MPANTTSKNPASQPSRSVSADEIKARIQSAYRQMFDARELTPRSGQRQMIAEITNTLAVLCEQRAGEPPVCVVEAGTGTGKTLAYLLAVVPMAQALGYKVVIATATIALQEQVVLKDIPELLQDSGLDFSYALAKGRGRYLCRSKLDTALIGSDSAQAMLDLYNEDLEQHWPAGDKTLYREMQTALDRGNWQGDRDDWKRPLADREWRPLTVDKFQCTGSRCQHYRDCCFFKARATLDKVDCIIANHDLVLADLMLGGGVVLPAPEQSLYIIDEAHQLPFKSNNHFASSIRIRGSSAELERCSKLLSQLLKGNFVEAEQQERLQQCITELRQGLDEAWPLLEQILESAGNRDSYGNRVRHTFELGVAPQPVRMLAANLATLFATLLADFERIADTLKQELEEAVDGERAQLAGQYYAVLGTRIMQLETSLALWNSYGLADPEDRAPNARWLSLAEHEEGDDMEVASSPVLAADNLRERLWSGCAGAVLSSATLSALGCFDMLTMRSGLPPHTRYLSIPSPFDFATAASFVVPRMNCEPSDGERHTALIAMALPRLLGQDCAALMLFSSRRQMQEVLQSLPEDWRERVLCQDDYQKARLLQTHRQRVDEGKGSVIFGLASFAEGVDLPGAYCTHVLIARIPFAVPNDPVEMTLSAWVEKQGKNPFMTLAVPDAAFRLVQASGRLLRSETDQGRITLFDERIIRKRYGKRILESMPPYRREIFKEEIGA